MRAVKPKVSPVGEGSVINLDKFNGEEVTYKNIVCLYLIDNNIVGSHSQKNTVLSVKVLVPIRNSTVTFLPIMVLKKPLI